MGLPGSQPRADRDRIKHIVMWNVVGTNEAEKGVAVAEIKSRFEALRGMIPGLLHLEIGVDVSRVPYACDIVLYSEFTSREALDAYANHPAHLRIRDELQGVRISRHQVDYVPSIEVTA